MADSGGSDDDLIADWRTVHAGVTLAASRIDQIVQSCGISAPWLPVLLLLLDAPEHRLPMSVLARDASMTSGGFTKLADRMAREGLVDRRASSADRRVVHAKLTDAGLVMARRAADIYRDALRSCLLGAVTAQELGTAAGIIGALARAHAPDAPGGDADVVTAQRSPAAPERRRQGGADS